MKVRSFMIVFKNYSRLGACMHNPESKISLNHANLKPQIAFNHENLNHGYFVDLLQNC